MAAHPGKKIVGFHQDEQGVWVAEFECGHQRHVHHDPPWVNREWVTTIEGRKSWIGRKMACALCAATHPPEQR